ncbi:type II TA system antitoxin MqsA family protein [Oceanivirga salmonicida]|uniref:type II TA system antitoxin MqsA family protein n=1 Tax=Oceanivirga salmonicida TaxID=1769291 RepID=UPI0012E246CA|nr:type II TA system antitoxin MqsA family protein [Oceanivirga salmonicida]
MNNKKIFCEECRKDTDFVFIKKQMLGTIKGETYTYIGKVSYCNECKSEVYVNEINDFNLKALYDKYREKNDIISLNKILEISLKYDIGKRPLSLLLGWGEQTFSRYCDGDIPTKQYSDILKKIYEDPKFYNQILEENKKKLKTELSYRKSKMAVEKFLINTLNENSKINMVIKYLLNKCEDITPLALQKSLYYIQGFYYAFYNKFLFVEECQAWTHGPVYPDIYSKYRDYRFDPIKTNVEIDDTIFSSSELAVLESVVKNICCYSGKVLEKFTHSETPWLLARGELKEIEPSNEIVNKEDIGKYFKSIIEKYNMINPNDIRAYAQTMFEQI